MLAVSWVRLTEGGKSLEHWKGILRKRGCLVDDDTDPFFFEPVPSHRPKKVIIDDLPRLQIAVQSLGKGETLVVPNFGHFGHSRVWFWVAKEAAKRQANVMDGETGKVFKLKGDPEAVTAIADGAALTESAAGKLRTAKAAKARAKSGRLGGAPKKYGPAKIDKARTLWGDDKLVVEDVVEKTGIPVATLRRKMTLDGKEKSRMVGKVEAESLHRVGRWIKKKGGK